MGDSRTIRRISSDDMSAYPRGCCQADSLGPAYRLFAAAGPGAARKHGFRMIKVLDSRNLHTANAPPPYRPLRAGDGRAGVLRCGWRVPAVAATVAVTLTACSSFGGTTGDSAAPAPVSTAPAPAAQAQASSNPSFASRVKSFFSGDSGNLNSPAPQTAANTADIACPGVEYRQGAATMAVNNPGSENTALGLRYQASFMQTARECILLGNNLTIKVGVQGRIVIGPAGGPGPITIPLRYALVREGAEPKTVWTKLFMVPVTIADNQLNVPWLHIEEEMTVPRPSSDELEAYVIYIGFDPEGAAAAKPKPAAKPKVARPR
jgi:hypothetical protein